MTTKLSPAAIKAIAEMNHLTEQQTNGALADSFDLLTLSGDSDAVRLTKSVISDVLARRNFELHEALSRWEFDMDSTESPDNIVLRHARQMKPSCRTHLKG
jgi:hypothetical protein